MPYDAPDLRGLSLHDIAALAAARKLPPISDWKPEKTGDSEMHITADGRWYHQGGEIVRPAMIRAFSSLLYYAADQHWLITPHEKLSIKVDDAPFIAVELRSEGEGQGRQLAFRLNSDDLIIADDGHSLILRNSLPYVHVRHGLWAKLARPVYYELMDMALSENHQPLGIWSNGAFFTLIDDQ